MARVTFSADERTQAEAGKSVLFAFAIDAEGCPGCPDRLLKFDGPLSPLQAEEITDLMRAKLKSFKAAG